MCLSLASEGWVQVLEGRGAEGIQAADILAEPDHQWLQVCGRYQGLALP